MRTCLSDIFWGIVILIFIAALIFTFSLVVIIVFGAILVTGIITLLIPDKKEKQKDGKNK